MKLLFIDTETGGIDPQRHSLLSIGLVVWEDGVVVATSEIFINDGNEGYTKEALSINNIDLVQHKKEAIGSAYAVRKMIEFTKYHFETEKITLAGHNVAFDIAFIKQVFKKNRRSFNNYFSHRSIDTSSILSYLQICNIIKAPIKSSSDAFRYFNISVNGRHTAVGDALATVELFNKLIELICR